MKKISLLYVVMALVGCTTTPSNSHPRLGMANPASTFCIEKGGQLELKSEENGQLGYCHLADGQIIEEWTYFRSQQEQCIAEQASQLVGQKLLTEDELKQRTKAGQIRVLMPNQPATMDYRSDRLTLVVSPETTIIEHSSCG